MEPDDRVGDAWRDLEDRATALPAGARAGALGGTGWWWVLRALLPAALTAALLLEYAFLSDSGCTVEEPCAPMPGWSLLDGLQVGATAAVWLVPGVGLPLSVVTSLPWVVDYALLGESGTASGVAAMARLAVAVAGSWLVLRLRHRPLPPAMSGRLPARGRDVLASRGLGTVELGVVLALVAVAGLLGWFAYLQADTRAHLSRAEAVEVEVVAVDEVDWVLEVRVPGVGGFSEVGVYDAESYDVGDRVPAHVDGTAEPAWVSLDQEPVEHDGWLVLAGALAALTVAVGTGRLSALRRRRRLLTEGGLVWSTTAAPGGDGSRVLLPELGLRAPLVRSLPADGLLEDIGLLRHEATADPLGREPVEEAEDGSEEEEDQLRQQEFAAAWRGERLPTLGSGPDGPDGPDDPVGADAVGPVLLIGDPRPGGVVVVVTADVVLAPHGSLLPMSPLDVRHLRSGVEVDSDRTAGDGPDDDTREDHDRYDAAGLPGSVAVPLPAGAEPGGADGRSVSEVQLAGPWWRLLAAASLLLLPAAFWLTADGSLPPEEQLTWFQSVGVLSGGGSVAFAGLAFARSSTRLRSDGVHLAANGFVVMHPWQAVAGIRVIDEDVVVAFGVDDDGDLDAVGGPPVGLDTAPAAGLAERWRLGAGTGSPADAPRPRRTVDPVVGGGVVLYALAAGTSVLWPLVSVAL